MLSLGKTCEDRLRTQFSSVQFHGETYLGGTLSDTASFHGRIRMPIHCTFIPRAEAVLTLGTAQQLGENGFFFPPPSEGRVSLTSHSPVLRVASSVSTRCCVPVNANNGPGSPPDVVLSLQLWSYVSGRERFTSRGEGSSTACTGGLFAQRHVDVRVRGGHWTRRGLFHSLIRRVDYRLKTTVGHAVVAAHGRTGADCCNLYGRSRDPERGGEEGTSIRRDRQDESIRGRTLADSRGHSLVRVDSSTALAPL